MDRTPLARVYSDKEQTEILHQIVNAMIAAQDALVGVEQDEWDQVLRGACRESREAVSEDESADLLAVC